jgi:hypothetical protein
MDRDKAATQGIINNIDAMVLQMTNEPTIGLYYVQEHIKATIPTYVELESEVESANEELRLGLMDIKHTLKETDDMGRLSDLWSPKMFYLLKTAYDNINKIKYRC